MFHIQSIISVHIMRPSVENLHCMSPGVELQRVDAASDLLRCQHFSCYVIAETMSSCCLHRWATTVRASAALEFVWIGELRWGGELR